MWPCFTSLTLGPQRLPPSLSRSPLLSASSAPLYLFSDFLLSNDSGLVLIGLYSSSVIHHFLHRVAKNRFVELQAIEEVPDIPHPAELSREPKAAPDQIGYVVTCESTSGSPPSWVRAGYTSNGSSPSMHPAKMPEPPQLDPCGEGTATRLPPSFRHFTTTVQ
ncbi:unnamed protein product [Pleuronectes platessa]|uniref:Uncharacterized protein n=1 Tax=Pleuronectes platessa TaxID=8262 RepID=A0A9N7Y7Z7_PLEPL|nr:unnamed protein product [Pleuronectes platessa]